MQTIRILIVDDHWVVRDGISSLLKTYNRRYKFSIDEAGSGEEAIIKVKKSTYDIVLMDYQMPKLDGAETTRALLAINPSIPVLLLSGHNESVYVQNSLKAGAKGYILKNTNAEELIKGIIAVVNNGSCFSNEISLKSVIEDKHSLKIKKTPSGKNLSEKEFGVLKLIAKGHTSQEIANKLFITKYAIDKHRHQLLKKMQSKNSISLLIHAKKFKLID